MVRPYTEEFSRLWDAFQPTGWNLSARFSTTLTYLTRSAWNRATGGKLLGEVLNKKFTWKLPHGVSEWTSYNISVQCGENWVVKAGEHALLSDRGIATGKLRVRVNTEVGQSIYNRPQESPLKRLAEMRGTFCKPNSQVWPNKKFLAVRSTAEQFVLVLLSVSRKWKLTRECHGCWHLVYTSEVTRREFTKRLLKSCGTVSRLHCEPQRPALHDLLFLSWRHFFLCSPVPAMLRAN